MSDHDEATSSGEAESYDYTMSLAEEKIRIKNREGKVVTFTLREVRGDTRNKYLMQRQRMANNPDMDALINSLLTKSLFGEDGAPVSDKELNSWPSKMQMDIFLRAVKISGLDRKAEDDAKNG